MELQEAGITHISTHCWWIYSEHAVEGFSLSQLTTFSLAVARSHRHPAIISTHFTTLMLSPAYGKPLLRSNLILRITGADKNGDKRDAKTQISSDKAVILNSIFIQTRLQKNAFKFHSFHSYCTHPVICTSHDATFTLISKHFIITANWTCCTCFTNWASPLIFQLIWFGE